MTVARGIFSLLVSSLNAALNVAFAVYAFVLFGQLAPVNSDMNSAAGRCNAGTTLSILLANGLVDVAFCLISTFNTIRAIVHIIRHASKDDGVEPLKEERITLERVITIASQVVVFILGTVSFAFLISISVYVWRDNCRLMANDSTTGYFYAFLQTFLIIYYVLSFSIRYIIGLVIITVKLVSFHLAGKK
jgi:hypothetical protein